MDLTLLYVHSRTLGYGRTGVCIADELRRRGVDLYDDDGRGETVEKHKRETDGFRAPVSPTNAISWISVPTHAPGKFDGQHKSILTMWESMRLPESFRETIHEFDLLMVPSFQNVELFSEYHPNVEFVPLGIDPLLWHYSKPNEPTQTFNFLISGRGSRKGIDLAYEAFKTVFATTPDGPVPHLTIKSLKGQGDYYGPDITHVTGRLTSAEEVALYRASHCYVQPSRGEGFGLQPLQAIATGRPTILTAAHGHESFAPLGIGLDAKASTADYFIFGDAGEWWEPDFEQLCEAMWDVYTNYTAHCDKAADAADEVAKNWTWSNTADRYVELLSPEMNKPYTGSGAWIPTISKLYKIVTIEDHYSEAAGVQRYFEKGKVYYDLADIKRILFDAGKLAPDCLTEDDHGLMPEQVAQIPEYIARNSHCPTCGQQLNTKPTYADSLYEQALAQ